MTSTEADGRDEHLTRREREKLQHRQEILDAAVKVFAEKGFYSATLDEVAQEAEFSKGALYLYFTNKEDILYSIIKTGITRWHEFINATMTGDRPFRDELVTLFSGLAGDVFANPDLFKLISAQHHALFNALTVEKRNELIDHTVAAWDYFVKRVEKAVAEGDIRNVPPMAIVGLVHGSINGMIHDRWNCKTKEQLMEAIVTFVDIIFTGLEPKGGTL